ncbi:hypothetical protein LINGRAHAP2_LOCUS29274 [Linum grandiflorum]
MMSSLSLLPRLSQLPLPAFHPSVYLSWPFFSSVSLPLFAATHAVSYGLHHFTHFSDSCRLLLLPVHRFRRPAGTPSPFGTRLEPWKSITASSVFALATLGTDAELAELIKKLMIRTRNAVWEVKKAQQYARMLSSLGALCNIQGSRRQAMIFLYGEHVFLEVCI